MNVDDIFYLVLIGFFLGFLVTYWVMYWLRRDKENQLRLALTQIRGMRRGLKSAVEEGDVHDIIRPIIRTIDSQLRAVETHLVLSKEK